MSLNENNLYSVQSKTGQPVIIVDGVAFPVGPVYNIEESTTDLSFITATANDILTGKVGADASGNPVYGNIQTVTASLSSNTITVPAGYVAEQQTLTVAEAGDVTVSGNTVTIPVGYVASQRTATVGTVKGAETFTPSTTDQTIAADTYLTGTQTIKGDANLLAENIKSGVVIFNVTGTFEGSGGGDSAAVEITVNPSSLDVEWVKHTSIGTIEMAASASDGGTPLFIAPNPPTGISVSSSGRITGAPQTVGNGLFDIYVSYPGAICKTVTVNYNVLLEWGYIQCNTPERLSMEVGTEFSYQFNAYTTNGGDITGYTATNLPAGLTLSNTGVLSGTPTTETSSTTFTLKITAYRCDDLSINITYTVDTPNDNSFETPYNWSDIASGTAVTDFDKTELKSNKQKVYIKVPLTAGTPYTFWCISDGASEFDEYLWLYDMNNTLLTSNDDTDGGSKFTYTPDTTGDYMLVLGSFQDNGRGKFNEITITPAPSADSGESSDSGESTERTYLFTVTGAGSTEVNGNYYDTGETVSSFDGGAHYKIYSNESGTGYLTVDSSCMCYGLAATKNPSLPRNLLYGSSSITSEVTIEWLQSVTWYCESGTEPLPTITEYAGDSGDSGSSTDIVSLLNLPRPISEYTSEHLGEIISVPYTDETGTITGPIEFEVVGVNHHKEVNDESLPTISLMCTKGFASSAFDAKEPDNPDSGRASYGNNRWSVSNIRQWLNSEGAAGGWYTPQHEYDAEPSYSNRPGFLTGISDDIKQYLATVRNITALNTVSDGGGSETTDDKVFLPSRTEIKGVANGDSIMEGSKLTYANINRGMVFARSAVTSYTSTVGVWDDCPGLGDYTSSYRADASLKIAPIIVLRGSVIEDNSGGDGTKTAVYRLEGCTGSMSTYNGDYYLTELTSTDASGNPSPVYQNENGIYFYALEFYDGTKWGFSDTLDKQIGNPHYYNFKLSLGKNVTPATGVTLYNAYFDTDDEIDTRMTFTKLESSSGESGGDSSSGYDYDKLEVSLSGKPLYSSISVLNGTYTRITTTEDSLIQAQGFTTEKWQRDEAPNIILEYGDGYWCFMNSTLCECSSSTSNLSAPWEETNGWDGELVCSITGTITKIGGNNNSDTSTNKTAVYRVSGCSTSAINGDYYLTEHISYQDNPVWVNDNGAYLFCFDSAVVPCWGFHSSNYYPNVGEGDVYDMNLVGSPESTNASWYNKATAGYEDTMTVTKL